MSQLLLLAKQFDVPEKDAAEIIRVADLRERLEESRQSIRPLTVDVGFVFTTP